MILQHFGGILWKWGFFLAPTPRNVRGWENLPLKTKPNWIKKKSPHWKEFLNEPLFKFVWGFQGSGWHWSTGISEHKDSWGLDQHLGGRIKNYSDTPIRIKPDKKPFILAPSCSQKSGAVLGMECSRSWLFPVFLQQQHKLQGNKGCAELIELFQRWVCPLIPYRLWALNSIKDPW